MNETMLDVQTIYLNIISAGFHKVKIRYKKNKKELIYGKGKVLKTFVIDIKYKK